MVKQKLTSVKVDIDSWDSFRKLSIDEKITFRELVEISLIEFINNKSFRKTIKEKVIKNGKKENIIIRR
jgi:hypothetical protein|tara:strand:- start:229 stop:435 length:207 start_codon:yes stop_codon:yes gene_type:complete